jgi:ABC-type glycerol-3-phosphate transport system substrate-binding protein
MKYTIIACIGLIHLTQAIIGLSIHTGPIASYGWLNGLIGNDLTNLAIGISGLLAILSFRAKTFWKFWAYIISQQVVLSMAVVGGAMAAITGVYADGYSPVNAPHFFILKDQLAYFGLWMIHFLIPFWEVKNGAAPNSARYV